MTISTSQLSSKGSCGILIPGNNATNSKPRPVTFPQREETETKVFLCDGKFYFDEQFPNGQEFNEPQSFLMVDEVENVGTTHV